MAYIVQFSNPSIELASVTAFIAALTTKLKEDGRFRVGTLKQGWHLCGRGKANARRAQVTLKNVRLEKAKPYCGQHPGECLVNPFTGAPPKKPVGSWLEWDDWVVFNNLINDVIDMLGLAADVWSNPPEELDKGSKFWIRKDNRRRIQYDWDEQERRSGTVFRVIRIWNHGTPDQFAQEIT